MPGRAPVLGAVPALAVLLVGCAGSPAPADDDADTLDGTVTVLAAASLTEIFGVLADEFEADHPRVEVTLGFGGSGALAEQIVAGVPADVFAAADPAAMAAVDDAALAVEPELFATNTLELVTPAGNPAGVEGLDDLARGDLVVALCDPSVPCGAAAARLLDLAGVTAVPDTLEEDVKAVLTKVSLGEADAGLVYRTDVRAAGDAVEGIEVAHAADVVNEYPIAALRDAPNPRAAEAFVAFVRSDRGREALDDAGFGTP